MLPLSDLILPPLIAYLVAATLGIALALLRARRSAPGWIALDVLVLVPAFIPVPVLANALLAAAPAGTNHLAPWLLAAALAALPFAYLPARIALAGCNAQFKGTARLLGLGPIGRFFRIDLPLTWPALGLAKLLALVRVLGEWLLVIGALDRVTLLTGGIVILSIIAATGLALRLPRLSGVR